MAKKESKSLFRRLTRLFKTGPIVKRKIRGLDTTMTVADKSKSSGTLLFQKSLSPTYATITSNAYNLSERLMRYQDFQEMEYSLAISTKIAVPGGFKTIGELADECSKDPEKTFIVYSYDHGTQTIVPALAKQARQTCVDEAFEVTFDNGKKIVASAHHRLMLRDGTYCVVGDLKPGNAMMPFKRQNIFVGQNYDDDKYEGYQWIYTMQQHRPTNFKGKPGWVPEHRLIAEFVSGKELESNEVVHHRNFKKWDNDPNNLMIMSDHDHKKYHTDIVNGLKWSDDNSAWIESFKHRHAIWMRDYAPTQRRDVTFAKILQVCDERGFSENIVCSTLDVSYNLVKARLAQYGFKNFQDFSRAYAGKNRPIEIQKKDVLLTKDLSVDLIKQHIDAFDSKQSACNKIGCTINVLDKFLNRKLGKSWIQLRTELGLNSREDVYKKGGRPKNTSMISYEQVCNVYTPGMNRIDLAKKLKVSTSVVMSRLNSAGFQKFSEWTKSYQNCKVVSIVSAGIIPLYDLTVDGYKNFATDSVISHNTPEIAAALDIYSDETVSADEKGRSLHIFSDNEKIKEILEDLFYNILNTEFNLRSWTRNLVKYGDLFLYNDVSPTHGVVNAFPIPVNEIEREENYDKDDPFAVRFRWVTLGNRTLENWEVTHFRLLGNDMFLPYGSSIIEPARRIWRQLILIEDAMLVYRVVRAPERRVFYIDVANVPPENVPMYVEEQRKNLRTNQVIDRTSGRVDLRYNPMCFQQLTRIPLLDGRTITVKELAEEWNSGRRDQETYSMHLAKGGRIVPGKIVWAGVSGHVNQLVRITLDDGGIIEVTPDHKMMLRDGNPIKARDLVLGDSLMPMHVRFKTMLSETTSVDDKNAYEEVLDPASGTYYFTHRLVVAAKENLDVYDNGFIAQQGHVIHHRDHNKRNNSSTNLELMGLSEHSKHHAELGKQHIIAYNKSDKKKRRVAEKNKERNSVEKMSWYNNSELHASHNMQRSSAMKSMWNDPDKRLKTQANMKYVWSEKCQALVIEQIRTLSIFEGLDAFLRRLQTNIEFMEVYALINKHLARDPKRSIHKNVVGKFITRDYADWKSVWAAHHPSVLGRKFVNNVDVNKQAIEGPNNHKVVAIEFVDVDEDVYNVTVDGYHNLAIQASNCTSPNIGKVQSFQSVDEDFFIPVRGGDSGTKIDTLAGGQNTAAVEDVAYIQKKLFAALKIPRAYLGYDDMLSCLHGDTQIPLLDGTSIRINELAQKDWSDERKQDQSTWVYSCDPVTGEIKPGKITKAWKTKEVDILYKIHIDDGGVIECTGNHPFLCRDGVYRRADELESGQSLMPVYKRLSVSKKRGGSDEIDGYEMILNNSTNEWEYTHRVVSKNFVINDHLSRKDERSYVLHHVDHNKLNNSPLNLIKMGKKAHALYHSTGAQANLLLESSRDKLRDVMLTDAYRSVHLKGVQQAWETNYAQRRSAVAVSNARHKRINVDVSILDDIANKASNRKEFAGLLFDAGLSWQIFRSNLLRANINVSDWLCEHFKGCHRGRKPKSNVTIEQIREHCVRYNITNITEWRRTTNAPVCGGIVRRILNEAGFVNFGDFRSTVPYNHKVSSIEIVHLDEPIEVFDLEVENFHNFAICTDPVGTDGIGNFIVVHNSKATLAQEDIRFSRTINVIQKTILSELNKLAIIHLYAHGYSGEDLQNFTLRLSNPSTVAQQQKLELWRSKFEIGGSLPEGMGSTTFVQREIWGLSDEQISDINDQRMEEKLFNARVEASATAAAEGAGAAGDDLFATDTGGGETPPEEPGGGGAGEEVPPPETAGEEPEEDVEPGIELLTSSDDVSDDEEFNLKLSSENDGPIVQVRPQLKKALYNRGRQRTHGASKTHMPDFRKMTSNDNQSMKDPYDNDWIKSVVTNPLNDSVSPRRQGSMFGGFTPDVWSTLGKMSTALNLPNKIQGSILTEGNDIQDEIDAKAPELMDESFDFDDIDND